MRTRPTHRQQGKALVWTIALLAIAAAGWWYFLPQTLPAPVRRWLPSPNGAAEVYKWRDEKGRLQLTSTPPADRPYETLRYDPKLNVVPSTASSTIQSPGLTPAGWKPATFRPPIFPLKLKFRIGQGVF